MIHRGTPFTLQEMAQGVSTSDFHMTPGNGKGNDMETKCGKTVHSVCVKVHLRVERTDEPTSVVRCACQGRPSYGGTKRDASQKIRGGESSLFQTRLRRLGKLGRRRSITISDDDDTERR